MIKQIKNLPYYIDENGNIYDKQNNIIPTYINPCGYVSIRLNDNIYTVAYLVANSFIDNPDNNICVGYIDGDYTNIKASNLFWYFDGIEENDEEEYIEPKQIKYNTDRHTPTKVIIFNKNGLIGEYKSYNKASKEINISGHTLKKCLLNKTEIKNTGMFIVNSNEYNKINIYEFISNTKKEKKQYEFKYYLISNENKIIKEFDDVYCAAKYFNLTVNMFRKLVNENNMKSKLSKNNSLKGCKVLNDKELKVFNDWYIAYNQAVNKGV